MEDFLNFYLMKTKMKVCHVGDESLSGRAF